MSWFTPAKEIVKEATAIAKEEIDGTKNAFKEDIFAATVAGYTADSIMSACNDTISKLQKYVAEMESQLSSHASQLTETQEKIDYIQKEITTANIHIDSLVKLGQQAMPYPSSAQPPLPIIK